MPRPAFHPELARRLITALAAASALAGCASRSPSVSASAGAAVTKRAPNRLSLTLQQDYGIVNGEDVCSKASQLDEGFACFRTNGTQYHGSPLPGGAPVAGIGAATTRLLVGFDRVLLRNWAFGVRGGVVIHGGGPKPDGADAPEFLPFHGEARAAYWFGHDPFARSGFRFGLFVAGGVAQVDTGFPMFVQEDPSKRPPAVQPNNPALQTLDAYKKSGTGFVGGGASVALAPSRSTAFFLNVKLMQLFPSDGTVIAPEIGYEVGF